MWVCEDEQTWRWADVKMRRCEDKKMWRWADVKMRRCEDEQMWRWEDVKMRRCEDEQMWRWADVKMRRCEDEQMWRWEDVKMSRCEDEKMWRWADVKMRRCEDEKVWRWEGVKMRRWDTAPHYWKNPALRRSREKWSFSSSPEGYLPPTTGVGELWKKKQFCNENRWNWVVFLQKNDEYFHGGPIFYVCSSARNWVSFMYKGIYHIRHSLWGVATLDVSSSSTRTFQQKTPGPPKWSISFYILYLKNEFFKLTEGYPPRPVSENYEKKTICNENHWN